MNAYQRLVVQRERRLARVRKSCDRLVAALRRDCTHVRLGGWQPGEQWGVEVRRCTRCEATCDVRRVSGGPQGTAE